MEPFLIVPEDTKDNKKYFLELEIELQKYENWQKEKEALND